MKKVVCSVALLMASAGAFAGDFYVGLHYGQSANGDFCNEEFFGDAESCEDKGDGNKLSLGFQFNNYIAVEVAHVNSGELTASGGYNDSWMGDTYSSSYKDNAEVKGWNLAAMASLPMGDSVSLFAKVGMFSWESELSGSWSYAFNTQSSGLQQDSGTFSHDDDGQSSSYGLGMSIKPSDSISLLLEWQTYADIEISGGDDSLETDVEMTTLGLQFQF